MTRALLVIDVQNDFTEGGALGVAGGAAVASAITKYLQKNREDYALVVASRDWHDGENSNGGHFSANPDYVATWPVHCVADTPGAQYHPAFDTAAVDLHILKGQGKPAYSIFEGADAAGISAAELLQQHGVTAVDVVGIATDYCVRQSALDAIAHGHKVRVLTQLTAGVSAESSAAALIELGHAGAEIVGAEQQHAAAAVKTVQLRRYVIVQGEFDAFLSWWNTWLPKIRAAHGFAIEFAYAIPETNEFVWAVSAPGDQNAFLSREQVYSNSTERAEAFAGQPQRIASSVIGFVEQQY